MWWIAVEHFFNPLRINFDLEATAFELEYRLSRFSQPRLSASVISANAMLASRIGTPSSRPSSVASRISLCPSFRAKLGGSYLFGRNRS